MSRCTDCNTGNINQNKYNSHNHQNNHNNDHCHNNDNHDDHNDHGRFYPAACISTQQLANSAVTTEKLLDRCVTGRKICDHTITNTQLASSCILSSNLTHNCVGTCNINDGAITSDKLSNNCVYSHNLTDGCVSTYNLTNGCVTMDQLDSAVVAQLTQNGVTLSDPQTIINKIINDPSNIVSCDNLHYNNGSNNINISHSGQPLPHQTLVANSSSNATWQYPDHYHMLHVGTNTHAQLDAFVVSTQNILNNLVTTNSGVSVDGIQTLTNKVIDDASNVVTSDNLHTNNGLNTVNISSSAAPLPFQSLIALDNDHATWQTIDHDHLSHKGVHTHAQIDSFMTTTTNTLNNLVTTNSGVSLDGTQTLTNKILDDPSNTITADKLHINSGNASIDVSSGAAPVANQALIATNSTHAIWKTINHDDLSNNGTLTHADLDAFVATTTETLNNLVTTGAGVSVDGTQTLTNKIINDPSNYVASDELHSNNGANLINVSASDAPLVNQVLIATNSTHATWQTMSHLDLHNIGTKSHDEIDAFIESATYILGNITTPVNQVTVDGAETLTHKILNDPTNSIACDVLHCNNKNNQVSIYASPAPTIHQALLAQDGSNAQWQTISHLNISDIGTHSHSDIDAFIASATYTLNNITTPLNEVTLAGLQTLTNKTIDDPTNTITAKSIACNNGLNKVNISSSVAPVANQSIVSTDGTHAVWKNIDHIHLDNIGTNTHAQIDAFILSATYTLNNITTPLNQVTLNGTQTFTNKTLDGPTNIVTGAYLSCNNGNAKVNVSASPIPSTNMCLITTDPTHSTWQYVDHVDLLNKGNNTHAQIDAFILSTTNTLNNLVTTNSSVSINGTQILTNKVIDDATNTISADFLHCNNKLNKVNISASPTPLSYQCLVSTGPTAATWQTVNHQRLSNIGTNTHAQIDTHLAASTGVHGITGNVVGTTDVQLIQNKVFDSTNTFPAGIGGGGTGSLSNYNAYQSNTVSFPFTYSTKPSSPRTQMPANPYVLITGMSLNVPSGTYLVCMTVSINVVRNSTITFALGNTSGLTPITNTIMSYAHTQNSDYDIVPLIFIITSDGTNPIKGLINITITDHFSNNIVTMKQRSLCATKLS